MKTSFVQQKISNNTVPVSESEIALLAPDDVKTEFTDQQSTDSKSEKRRDTIDLASTDSNAEISVTERDQPSKATRISSRNKKTAKKIWRSYSYRLA